MSGRFETRVALLGAGIYEALAMIPEAEREKLLAQLSRERTELDQGTGELEGIKLLVDAVLRIAG